MIAILAAAAALAVAILANPMCAFGRANRQVKNRTRLSPTFQPSAPPLTWTAAIVATKARITTNLPYTLNGTVPAITVQGVNPTAITPITSTTFDLTYAANVVSTNVLIVPAGVNQVRNSAGGALAAGQVTFP